VRAFFNEMGLFAPLAGDQDILIIVGAAHLVGDDGTPMLLKAWGIKVKRVQEHSIK